jgi:acyl carrier protein
VVPAAAAAATGGLAPAAEPATATERAVAKVWCEVLGRDRVRVTDNFFDAGGDSMRVVVLRARLAELLGIQVGVVDLFRFPTVRALAAWLDGDADGHRLRRAAQRAAARRNRGRSRR